jgi:uncharacterized protein (DUF342 family)
MAYNKFRWWTKGRPNKPLKADAPLLLKIRNGDFNYSYMFAEATEMRNTATKAYEQTYSNYGGTDEKNRIDAALEASRMKRVKALKLELEAAMDEEKILWNLRQELKKEFGKDLWDKAMERQRGKGTLEELYEWYRKNSKVKNPQSIQDIQLKRANTNGLEYLF